MWNMRYLTLLGKINIFKTLAISKLVFISYMSAVPNSVIKQINQIHRDFIWDGKKAKIKHTTLIADYRVGGLRDIDISTKIKSLQLSWVRRLDDSNFHPWKIIPKYLLSKLFGNWNLFFFPNMELKITPFFSKLPKFYQNILQFWSELSTCDPLTPSSILSESIFFNRFIKIDKHIVAPSFFNLNKTLYVADFFDENGKLKNWTNFKSSTGIHTSMFFKWCQLADALPIVWKDILKNSNDGTKSLCEFRPHIITLAKMYPLDKLSSKELYQLTIASSCQPPTSQKKILDLLEIDELPWVKVYSLIRSTSIDSYSRIFQYKCLNNILFLNNTLYKLGFSDTPLCSYCNCHNETTKHLFFDCCNTKSLWRLLQIHFESSVTIPDLDLRSAIVGFLDRPTVNISIFNNILLTFKMSLYKSRDKKQLHFSTILNNIKARENIENYIAHENNKLEFHHKKWSSIKHLLS